MSTRIQAARRLNVAVCQNAMPVAWCVMSANAFIFKMTKFKSFVKAVLIGTTEKKMQVNIYLNLPYFSILSL